VGATVVFVGWAVASGAQVIVIFFRSVERTNVIFVAQFRVRVEPGSSDWVCEAFRALDVLRPTAPNSSSAPTNQGMIFQCRMSLSPVSFYRKHRACFAVFGKESNKGDQPLPQIAGEACVKFA
jgi:hypothetical protein